MSDVKQDPTKAEDAAQEATETATEGQEAQVDWQAKAQENWDAYLRTRAELDNVQKRNQRQVEDAQKFAIERFANDLLAVKDSLEAALTVEAQGEAGVEQLHKGVEMTLTLLNQVFERFGITPVEAMDQRFDPNHHLAIATVESPGEANRVVQVHQKGYLLKERLLRPAMVSVSKVPTG